MGKFIFYIDKLVKVHVHVHSGEERNTWGVLPNTSYSPSLCLVTFFFPKVPGFDMTVHNLAEFKTDLA